MVRKEFYDAVEAQEFYLKQPNQLFWHWNVEKENGRIKYILERKLNENATDDIISIEDLGYTDEYVYDIETEDGTFQCGPGCMIVKNTDSIYTQFTLPEQDNLPFQEKVDKIFDVSNECAKRITETFKPPIELEMEKVMLTVMLFSKKRYAMAYREKPKSDTEIEAKGIQLVRRDNCPYVKKISNPILEKLLIDQDIKAAEMLTKKYIKDLLENKVDIYDLVISKSLKSKYIDVNKAGHKVDKPAHWYLAQKMKERDRMTAPKAGDRVPYVFIENSDKHAKQKDRVEDPIYVLANPTKCKPDVLYYLEKQIASPLETLFSVIVKDPKTNEIFPLDKNNKISKECKKAIANLLWENAKRRKINQARGQLEISNWFKKE